MGRKPKVKIEEERAIAKEDLPADEALIFDLLMDRLPKGIGETAVVEKWCALESADRSRLLLAHLHSDIAIAARARSAALRQACPVEPEGPTGPVPGKKQPKKREKGMTHAEKNATVCYGIFSDKIEQNIKLALAVEEAIDKAIEIRSRNMIVEVSDEED